MPPTCKVEAYVMRSDKSYTKSEKLIWRYWQNPIVEVKTSIWKKKIVPKAKFYGE